ncbi:MAG: M48 family metalloprotease [Thermonemataceae bacterium]
MHFFKYSSLLLAVILFTQCKKPAFYSIQEQKELGQQVRDEILSKPNEYPVMSQQKYPEAYRHINRITNTILNSGKVKHRNDFDWEVYLIQDDKTLNAFCTPGGYIFVYTGLIKYLDTEDQLAGVMGHEIAHADLEHSARQIEKQQGVAVGVSVLAAVLLGNSRASQDAAGLVSGVIGLTFSRKHETEADMNSVVYLANTPYQCTGAAGFFQKVTSEGKSSQPAF